MESFARFDKWLAATLSSDALIVSMSSGVERWSGYAVHELIGSPLSRILSDSSSFELPRILETAAEFGYWEGKIQHIKCNGNILESRGTVLPLHDGENNSCGYFLFCRFDHAVPSVGYHDSLAAEIATDLCKLTHDLNNPLAVTMGFTQLLLLDQSCQDNVRREIEKIYSELKRVTAEVERLHRYALRLHEEHSLNLTAEKADAQASA
jgi:nitrogen-specific signal transduction histidine kinase